MEANKSLKALFLFQLWPWTCVGGWGEEEWAHQIGNEHRAEAAGGPTVWLNKDRYWHAASRPKIRDLDFILELQTSCCSTLSMSQFCWKSEVHHSWKTSGFIVRKGMFLDLFGINIQSVRSCTYALQSVWVVSGFTLHVNVIYSIYFIYQHQIPLWKLLISSAAKVPVQSKVNPFNTLI